MYERHYEGTALVDATPPALFAHLDAHEKAAGHMRMSSWMMVGGRMDVRFDATAGRSIGSRIWIEGRVLGVRLHAEEVVTVRDVPSRKVWETSGDVRLLIIGPYRMGFDITPEGARSDLRVFLDYDLPPRGAARWLGRVLGPVYARWCTNRMLGDARRSFDRPEEPTI